MRKKALCTAILAVSLTLIAGGAWAEEDLVEYVVKSCQPELESYCSKVTPGDGRLLACFYAHGDKLSGRCEYALYTAAVELEAFVGAVTHLAIECHDDLLEHCGEVEMGEGRVASCLLEHQAQASKACQQAIEDAELEAVDD